MMMRLTSSFHGDKADEHKMTSNKFNRKASVKYSFVSMLLFSWSLSEKNSCSVSEF